eukprot:CAMPEP_0202965314 /NCGR_PEP_ID=MMETSP1396-20130829/9330_1 /ASSEMBLY_ACC=CAM_ASM_000872 /TAXON_ID= /ORGANISM="Pseudokeronopsis sp., Strain Brazil" /LENGTH=133 /DNA_ID=CAMNT_0049687987 /DNA_START=623 /DNA_END=1024 /DNA_ORIENTATION=-
MTGGMPFLPAIQFGVVDVRDVARMHLLGIQVPAAANQRFIANSESFWFREIAIILQEAYGNDYKISTKQLAKCPAWFGSLFSKDLRQLMPQWNKHLELSSEKAQKTLGMNFINGKDAILAMAESLIASGMVPD